MAVTIFSKQTFLQSGLRAGFAMLCAIFFVILSRESVQAQASSQSSPQSSPQAAIPQYQAKEPQDKTLADKTLTVNNLPPEWNFVPFIVQPEDRFQSYIQDNGLSVWVNVPSLQKNGDTLTAIIKRVIRYDITHRLTKDLVYVDVVRFNTRNDTFARIASMDKKTGTLALTAKPEWERTSLDLDMTALYHFVGFLYDEKLKK